MSEKINVSEIETYIKHFIIDCDIEQLIDLYNSVSPNEDKLELNDIDYMPE